MLLAMSAPAQNVLLSVAQQQEIQMPPPSGYQRDRFADFISVTAGEELNAQEHIQAGKDPSRDRIHYSKILQIHENEEQIIRMILFDAYNRIVEQDMQIIATGRELNRNYSADLAAKRKAMILERGQIYDDAIARLKPPLGEEDFNKLDAYLVQTFPRGRVVTVKPAPRTAPSPSQSNDSPAQSH
jgi:hypothetical protein